jgi:hypothetical protein
MGDQPWQGLQNPKLRTPPGCGFQINVLFPGCVLRTTRGYPLPSLRDDQLCYAGGVEADTGWRGSVYPGLGWVKDPQPKGGAKPDPLKKPLAEARPRL